MRANRLVASAKWVDLPTESGWLGTIKGTINGDYVAGFVGGAPLLGEGAIARAVDVATRHARDLADHLGAKGPVAVSSKLPSNKHGAMLRREVVGVQRDEASLCPCYKES